jgi:ribonuclease VapC
LIVVDSSALICVLRGEPDLPRFRSLLLAEIGNLRISAANYLEAAIVVDSNDQATLGDAFNRLIDYLQIEVVAVTSAHVAIARQAHRTYGKGHHAAKLNFGDCFAYALAKAEDAPLLFKGDDFARTDVKIASHP